MKANGIFANLSQKETAAAARGCMVKFSSGRRRVILLAEALLFPFVRIVDWLRSRHSSASERVHKILVIEGGNLGDIVAILPFLKSLRVHFPGAQIALLANRKTFPLLDNLRLVDELIPVHFPWSVHFSQWKRYNPLSLAWFRLMGVIVHIRRERFDIAFSGRGDIRDNFVVWLTGIRRRVGYGFLGGGSLMTEVVTPNLNQVHCSERWLQLLKPLGKPSLDSHPHLDLDAADQKFASEFLMARGVDSGELMIGIHPGARIATRQWGQLNFSSVGESLARQFPVRVLWFQDPGERHPAPSSHNFIPVALPLRQFMSVLSRCKLLICNDSGPMHIASALSVPVVAVFGPTEPAWFGPLGERDRIVIRQPFWCRPCADRCVFDQPYCLRTISVNQVLSVATDWIARRISISTIPSEP